MAEKNYKVTVDGPYGEDFKFELHNPRYSREHYVFIGGGYGIAPIHGMLETAYDYAENYTAKAYLSAKTNDDLY